MTYDLANPGGAGDEEHPMTTRMRMTIKGMSCDGCGRTVARALAAAGATGAEADWRRGEAVFAVAVGADLAGLAEAVRAASYTPGEARPLERATAPGHRNARGGHDLVILGGGSAAFAAAIRARDLGARVAVVEHGTLGGTCVNVGCLPSKTLLRAGEVFYQADHHPFAGLGVRAEPAGLPDLRSLVAQKDELVAAVRKEKYTDLLAAYGIDLLPGTGRFADQRTVQVDGQPLTTGAYVLATGATPAVPPIPGLREAGYLTSASALDLAEVPGSLAVLGAGAVGLELGQFFAHVGSRVLFFDVAGRVAASEEPEVSAALAGVLREQGAEVHTPASVTGVQRDGDRRVLHAAVGGEARRFVVDQVLVATGRRPNTAGLDAAAAGIRLDAHGAIVVDATLRTSNPAVFAAGDVTTAPQYVYVAAHQGALAAENALNGHARQLDLTALPRVTFTTPPIAAAGLTEAEALAAGHQVATSVLPMSAVPRALVNHDTRGLVKLVADASTGKLLGVHLLAEGAGEVIQAAVYALKYGLTTTDLAETWSPYLTIAEGLRLAAQAFTRDVRRLSCCAA